MVFPMRWQLCRVGKMGWFILKKLFSNCSETVQKLVHAVELLQALEWGKQWVGNIGTLGNMESTAACVYV